MEDRLELRAALIEKLAKGRTTARATGMPAEGRCAYLAAAGLEALDDADWRAVRARKVGDRMNVAFLIALASALDWPHTWLGRALLLGFPITGDMETASRLIDT